MPRVSSSFRDPSGYVFEKNGIIYRKVGEEYRLILQELATSGLSSKLVSDRMLLPFEWVSEDTLKPEQVPFISYPYEWSFSMLKDAALLTLRVQQLALEHNMILKDASAYNVQFVKGKPILIDHLSFYPYEEGKPWVAYRQFCKHFLAPLALTAYKGFSFIRQLQLDMDGPKLGEMSRLLPFRAKLRPGILMHLVLNGADSRAVAPRSWMKISKFKLLSLIKSLESTVRHLNWEPTRGWKDYEKECNYSDEATHKKAYIVEEYLRKAGSRVVADLGANVGLYSQVALDLGCRVIAVDSDPACVELCYKSNGGDDCLPLVVDLANPSPALGWESTERDSFISRLSVDTVMALALVHHLAIGNNLPLDRISTFLANISGYLVVEWVPREDSQVQKMLKFREDVFPNYTKEGFEEAFSRDFSIVDCKQIEGSLRSVYLMEVKYLMEVR